MSAFDIIFFVLSAIVILIGILLTTKKASIFKNLQKEDIKDFRGYCKAVGFSLILMGSTALAYSILTNLIISPIFVMICSICLILGFLVSVVMMLLAKNKYS